jgi:glutathione S-transferase
MTPARTLVIGTKTYSSWSYRPWFMLVEAGIAFEEEVIPLRRSDTAARIAAVSPNGKVPLLIDGTAKIWESIAILDHLAERFPEEALWPGDPAARAHARAVSAEMHAGFGHLRSFHPFHALRAPKPRAQPMPDAVAADLARVAAIWTEARTRFGAAGPFLYGRVSIADAMYAPVVNRFQAYAVPVAGVVADYIATMTATGAWARWVAEAAREPADWRILESEVD